MNEPIKRYRSHITDTMKLTIPKTRTELKQHLNDPLFKNSYFLMATDHRYRLPLRFHLLDTRSEFYIKVCFNFRLI